MLLASGVGDTPPVAADEAALLVAAAVTGADVTAGVTVVMVGLFTAVAEAMAPLVVAAVVALDLLARVAVTNAPVPARPGVIVGVPNRR